MAKGWQLPEAYEGTYRLEFDDPSFDGLKVICRRHTFHSVEVAAKLLEIDAEQVKQGKLNSRDFENVKAALREMSDVIVKWNLRLQRKDGSLYTPRTDYESLTKLDLVFMMQIFMVWLKIMVKVEFENMKPAEIPMEVTGTNG
jgi:hypothetical protein